MMGVITGTKISEDRALVKAARTADMTLAGLGPLCITLFLYYFLSLFPFREYAHYNLESNRLVTDEVLCTISFGERPNPAKEVPI